MTGGLEFGRVRSITLESPGSYAGVWTFHTDSDVLRHLVRYTEITKML